MTGFVFLRVRAHRLLLAAALLAVLLTTSVLATLAAFSGSIGDAGLRNALSTRSAAAATLIVKAELPAGQQKAADAAVRSHADKAFDGLPVTVRKLSRSGPYALPRSLQAASARGGDPDLTFFSAIDHSRVRLASGAWPHATTSGAVQTALPETVAKQLKLRPGTRLTLVDRLSSKKTTVLITGVYRPADRSDPYWQLDDLGGRGTRTVNFTTYGPLLTDPADLTAGRVSSGATSWQAAADYSTITTDRIDRLRASAAAESKAVTTDKAFGASATATTSLPEVLGQAQRSLLVSRSTLLIVALQLVLLAGYALLLVARLLSSERAGETELLRARGGSKSRITALSAIEALLLALPAAVCGPLLAGPLTRLLGGQGALARIGLHLDSGATATVWLIAGAVALGCAAAVVAPALSAGRSTRGRAASLPAPVRAGADVGLLIIAGVAYWQLDRQTSGSGALTGDRSGKLGIDPLLVAAPALALLAGTVLTLRLLPPVAKLAERRAAGGRGLPAALAGWQFSRRPLRNAGPVLLLVLAVSMGILAIGQGASWDRSQSDQADFRSGASIRVLGSDTPQLGQAGLYASLPGVRDAAPVSRTFTELSGNRIATVLAVDLAHAPDQLMLRDDLADGRRTELLRSVAARKQATSGVVLPQDASQIQVEVRLSSDGAPDGVSPLDLTTSMSLVVEDRYGLSYRLRLGELPVDGRPHVLTADLAKAAEAPAGKIAQPLRLTGVESDLIQQATSEQERFDLRALRSVTATGAVSPVKLPGLARWQGSETVPVPKGTPQRPDNRLGLTTSAEALLSAPFATGSADQDAWSSPQVKTVRISTKRPSAPPLAAIATDSYLRSTGAKVGDTVDTELGGRTPKVRIVGSVAELPTTGAGATTASGSEAPQGGALLLDLRAVNQLIASTPDTSVNPTEWWLSTDRGKEAEVAAALRARADLDPAQVLARDETAKQLLDDPLGAGPQSALTAAALVAAALAAVGFAVSAVGSLRERSEEFAVLRALGAPRRQLARTIAAEQGVLIVIALLVGLTLGTVLTRAVVPLIVLTGQAAQPVPDVLVQLPLGRVALTLLSVAAVPLLIVTAIALRRADPAVTLRHQGGN
ncbi:ABC transporter permease [Streptomyces sp. NBC_01465]|uniref:ABC transporter permease n=1 Tax=Streptomyces sp. NBC_01465 TaxID=2903878 RepID=UPI002E30C01F|nr:ABC transporter permease [Streptomyces sp. NBC_01465]